MLETIRTDPDICRFTIAGICWLARDTDRNSLTEVTQALEGGGELLRETPHRRVLRIEGRRPLIVKHYSPRGIAANLKTFIRQNPALREWTALRKAMRLGLPVPEPVAVGRRYRGLSRESFLITEALDDARPLSSYLFGTLKSAFVARRDVARAAALVIRRMHDAGIFHKDLHLDNLIVRSDDVGTTVHLIDFQRVAFYRSLNAKGRMLNLATLHGGCMDATRSERLRFLKVYLGDGAKAMGDLRRLAACLDKAGTRHRRHIWRSRQRRCLAENREFKKIRLGQFVGMMRRDQDDAFQARLRQPPQLFSYASLMTSSLKKTVGHIALADRTITVARYHAGLLDAMKNLCASSCARRAWVTGNNCVLRGVSTATPLAYLERRHWRFWFESYLINQTVKGEGLRESLAQCAREIGAKRRLIDDFARYIARLHNGDVDVGQLNAKDTLVWRKNGGFTFCIIDFDKVSVGPVSRRMRRANLDKLAREFHNNPNVSKTDRLRFLKAYLSVHSDREWKKFARDPRARTI
jgi:tRNA A-37 threonylcarbamoyl transferase component Bud32